MEGFKVQKGLHEWKVEQVSDENNQGVDDSECMTGREKEKM